MNLPKIKLKVYRFTPGGNAHPEYREYEVERTEKMSVLSALQYIYENLDGSLSMSGYFCYRRLCGLCRVRINGKNRLSCRTGVEDGMVIEPAEGYPVIKDLAVDFSAGRDGMTEEARSSRSSGPGDSTF